MGLVECSMCALGLGTPVFDIIGGSSIAEKDTTIAVVSKTCLAWAGLFGRDYATKC